MTNCEKKSFEKILENFHSTYPIQMLSFYGGVTYDAIFKKGHGGIKKSINKA